MFCSLILQGIYKTNIVFYFLTQIAFGVGKWQPSPTPFGCNQLLVCGKGSLNNINIPLRQSLVWGLCVQFRHPACVSSPDFLLAVFLKLFLLLLYSLSKLSFQQIRTLMLDAVSSYAKRKCIVWFLKAILHLQFEFSYL